MILLAALVFALCPEEGKRVTCTVDGDTLWLQGEKIRIADIDAPETHEPKCASEKALGDRATDRLSQLLNGGPVVLQRQGQDRYGRTLANVSVNGRDVGNELFREGLARAWDGARHPWC